MNKKITQIIWGALLVLAGTGVFFQNPPGNAKNREDRTIFSNHAIYLFLFLSDRCTPNSRWFEKDL